MRKYFLWGLSGFLLAWAVAKAADLPIPTEIFGSYAPSGNCQQEPRVVVNAMGAFIESGGLKSGPLPVDVCYSCAGGARYSGIERWLLVKMGKNQWGDNFPVTLRFNANEQAGRLAVEYDPTTKTPLNAPLQAVVKASPLSRCKVVQTSLAAKPTAAPTNSAIVAQDFSKLLLGLMKPTSMPANTYYDWRYMEQLSQVQWAPLPPTMLDKPMADGHYFRRDGLAKVGNQSLNVIAAGARTMVMAHHFRNTGMPLGETNLLNALKQSGFQVIEARCPIQRQMPIPKWYRLTHPGKQPAFLWIVPASTNTRHWEAFNLSLLDTLPPLTPAEKQVYTDQCL